MSPLAEVAALFIKLGFTAFGGPAAHIGIMHNAVVVKRKWLTDEQFLDLLGATNLIPGPNLTEMAIHIGYVRAGWLGLIVSGLGFILPATFIVLGLAWLYVKFGTTPQVGWLLYGIKPVVVAIIAQALWNLGSKALRNKTLILVGSIAFALYFLGINEILLLFAGGLVLLLIANIQRIRDMNAVALLPLSTLAFSQIVIPFSFPVLFLTFLKIGSVLYGSGYILLAFLRADFVDRLGWLTDQQLIDAVAIGQFTPGPVFTTATFIGYVVGGLPGALLATLAIFLPAFVFVAFSGPLLPKVRSSPRVSALLDGVNATALGLMAGVLVELARAALIDPLTIVLALAALVLLLKTTLNS